VVLTVFALVGLYYFFKNMPTDLQNPRPRPHYDRPGDEDTSVSGSRLPKVDQGSVSGPGNEESTKAPQHYFNGPIKFFQLASSLHAMSRDPLLADRVVVCFSEFPAHRPPTLMYCVLVVRCGEFKKRFNFTTDSL
jgi:hypothetical protein